MAGRKTGSLVREIADIDYIVVDNEREALALENNLIKQHKPKFNVLLRDDKTYPYIRYTAFEKYPRVYVTRRLEKDGSIYSAHISRQPRVPDRPFHSQDVSRALLHGGPDARAPAALPAVLHSPVPRTLRPGLTTDENYAEAARDTKMFLEGRRHDLMKSLESRMLEASGSERFEQAASYRDLLRTLDGNRGAPENRRRRGGRHRRAGVACRASAGGRQSVSSCAAGRVVDRRDFYWEDLQEFEPAEFLSSLLKQLYLDAAYLPRAIHVPMDFEDRALLEEILSERAAHLEPPRSRVEILMPQRGREACFPRAGREKCAALLRAAVPRA